MWKYSLLLLLGCTAFASVIAVPLKSAHQPDYNIAPSRQVAYYHYPTPSRGFELPNNRLLEHQQQQLYSNNGFQVNYAASAYGRVSGSGSSSGAGSGAGAIAGVGPSAISQQFTSPVLEQAAFTMALTNQGYRFGAIPPAHSQPRQSSPPSSPSLSSSATLSSSLSPSIIGSSDAYSLNVKLPLPLGSAPIKLGPLPLQAGAPYSSIPRGLTSYGTPHPQRR